MCEKYNCNSYFLAIELDAPIYTAKIFEIPRWRRVRKPTARHRSSRIVALTPGPWIERPTFPGLVTESPLTPGRYEVLDKQLGPSAQRRVLYARASARYYVHYSRVYSRDVCTSNYANNDERERKKEERAGEQSEKETTRERETKLGKHHRAEYEERQRRAYIDMPSARGRDSPRLFPRFPTSHEAASYSLSPSRTTLRRIPHDDKSLDILWPRVSRTKITLLSDVTGLSKLSPNRGPDVGRRVLLKGEQPGAQKTTTAERAVISSHESPTLREEGARSQVLGPPCTLRGRSAREQLAYSLRKLGFRRSEL
ncbi:Uncharacterized protein DBV15_10971 [Temnothorax longispinosus]|uniref:Uncharacterized protein n=1 Tax=Temnothorax longispinosus TaxID=300112 RepID=A0A4S2L3T2_9HYME|nr:Uncharacterized protein DBV15_10971 [Temnothorax longispinosus]